MRKSILPFRINFLIILTGLKKSEDFFHVYFIYHVHCNCIYCVHWKCRKLCYFLCKLLGFTCSFQDFLSSHILITDKPILKSTFYKELVVSFHLSLICFFRFFPILNNSFLPTFATVLPFLL